MSPVDPSDSTQGDVTERPTASDTEAAETPSSDPISTPAEGGEAGPQAHAPDGEPRPRRRRRRRRRPGQAGHGPAAAAAEGSLEGEAADAGESFEGEPG